MSRRAVGPHFVIVGTQAEGKVRLTASHCVRDLRMDEDYGATHRLMRDRDHSVDITARTNREDLVEVVADDYPGAWTRLFDLWLPSSFTEETRTQILTHYTFNPPTAPQSPPRPQQGTFVAYGGSGGSITSAITAQGGRGAASFQPPPGFQALGYLSGDDTQ